MDAVLASTIDILEDVVNLPDWESELAFTEPRHTEPITGLQTTDGSWRLKERVKTASVALVLCLNVGVDPPDIAKIEPCAHLECWFDPLSEEPQKAIECISIKLEKQYEQWHPRPRYKKCLDPTSEEVKRLCLSLRRVSRDDRVLFHYNGHGVPKPTQQGEIWVFNEKYTQYIPVPVFEIQLWMGAPSIFVYDCSSAGSIVDSYLDFAKQRRIDYEKRLSKYNACLESLNRNQVLHMQQNQHKHQQTQGKKSYDNLHGQNGDNTHNPEELHKFQDDNVETNGSSDLNGGPPEKLPDYENCLHLAACEANQILPMQPDLPADLFTSCLTTPIKMALRWFIQKNDLRMIPKVSLDLIDKIPGSLHDRRTMLGELNWIFTAITDTIAWGVLPRDLFHRLYREDLLVASLFRNFLLADRIIRSYNCTPVSYPKLPKTYHHPMWRAWDMVVDLFLSQLVDVIEEKVPFKTSVFFAEQLTAFEVWLDRDHSSNSKFDHQLLPIVLQVLLSPVHRLRALDLLSRFLNLGPSAVNSALSVGIFPYVLKLLQSHAREVRPFLLSIWVKILAIDRRCQVEIIRDNYHGYFLTILSDINYDAHYRTMAAFAMTCIVRDYPVGQEVALQANIIASCLEPLDDPDPMLRKWLAICLATSWNNYEDARWCGVRSCAHEKLYSLLDDPDPEVRAASVYALGTFINSSLERTDHANTIDHSIGMKLVSTSLYDSSVLVRHELVVALQYLVFAFESQILKLEQVTKDGERNQHEGKRQRYHIIWKAIYTLAMDPHPRISSAAQIIIDEIRSRTISGISSESLRESKSNSSISESSSPNTEGIAVNVAINKSRRYASSRENNMSEDDNRSNLSSQKPLLTTDFVDWCTKYFVDPENNFTSARTSKSKEDQQREWRILRVMSYKNVCLRELMVVDPMSFNEELSSYKAQQVPNLIEIHPYDPIMVVAGRDEFSIMRLDGPHVNNYDVGPLTSSISSASIASNSINLLAGGNTNIHYHHHHHNSNQSYHNGDDGHLHDLIGTQSNCHSSTSQITSLQLINPQYNTLICTGSSEGSVRIWRAYNGIDYSFNPQLITAFHLMPELQTLTNPHRQGPGMVLVWDQDQKRFFATSDQNDVRSIKVWDAASESKIQDIPTWAEFGVTCLSSDGEHSIAAGYLDGSIRIYDTRINKTDCRTFTFRKHYEKILGLHLFKPGEKHINLVSGDLGGEVRFWDKRAPTSVKRVDVGQKMNVMRVHPNTDVFACGLKSGQGIKIYNLDGTSRAGCVLKCQDNTFFTSRHNPSVSCLAFHPLKTSLVAGYSDAVISIYSSRGSSNPSLM